MVLIIYTLGNALNIWCFEYKKFHFVQTKASGGFASGIVNSLNNWSEHIYRTMCWCGSHCKYASGFGPPHDKFLYRSYKFLSFKNNVRYRIPILLLCLEKYFVYTIVYAYSLHTYIIIRVNIAIRCLKWQRGTTALRALQGTTQTPQPPSSN